LTTDERCANVKETVERGFPMNGDTYGPFNTITKALAKMDALEKVGIKSLLNSNIVKGTAKYHKRGFLIKATFKWTVTEGNKPAAPTEKTLGNQAAKSK
jgi:hypothetical protein